MDRRSFVRALGGATVGLIRPSAPQALAIASQGSPMESADPASVRIVSIDAAPGPLRLDTAHTAVLVVDMQNDFGAVGGAFERAGIDISMIQAAVPPTARVLEAARRSGMAVVYLKMAFRPDLSDAGAPDSLNYLRHEELLGLGRSIQAPNGKASRILIRDTWNTDIVAELAPHPNDIVLYKHRFSGFFETDLDAVLKARSVKYLIVTGCTTSICVESTIRDAMFRDYSCVLLKDCTGEPIGYGLPRSNHDASLLTIETLLGWASTSEQLLSALRGHASVLERRLACHSPGTVCPPRSNSPGGSRTRSQPGHRIFERSAIARGRRH